MNVLFVSKAVAPPFRDGSSCLVRDLALAMSLDRPTVLSTRDAPNLAPHVRMDRIYQKPSAYAPALVDNLRVLKHLITDLHHDLWHFVFAPNPTSSRAGAMLRRIRRRPVVQTVASRPWRFEGVNRLLFGDHVVALSRYTADALVRVGVPARRVSVIPPPIQDIARDEEACREARRRAGVPQGVPLFVYAGDLEFSNGAVWMAEAAPEVLRKIPEAVILFACRAKTERAALHRDRISNKLESFGQRVRFLGEVPDLPALLASATAVPFPVDDLYGKVDLPYVLLEAALLRIPVLVPRGGPLEEIGGVEFMDAGDDRALARWCIRMARDTTARGQVGVTLRSSVLRRHDPAEIAKQVHGVYENLM